MANNFELPIPAEAWTPAASNGCGRSRVADRSSLKFANGADSYAVSCQFQLPAAYTGAGTLKADIQFRGTSTSGTVPFSVAVEAWTPGTDTTDVASSSFDTANTVTPTMSGSTNAPQKATLTLANKDSVAAGDWVRLKLGFLGTTGGSVGAPVFVPCVTLREEA